MSPYFTYFTVIRWFFTIVMSEWYTQKHCMCQESLKLLRTLLNKVYLCIVWAGSHMDLKYESIFYKTLNQNRMKCWKLDVIGFNRFTFYLFYYSFFLSMLIHIWVYTWFCLYNSAQKCHINNWISTEHHLHFYWREIRLNTSYAATKLKSHIPVIINNLWEAGPIILYNSVRTHTFMF